MLRITTPLFYVNNKPHIGHLYSILYADAINQWKSQTMITQFLTGTDEHGQKIQQSAFLNNLQPQQFCDKISQDFQSLLKNFKIIPDIFVRTTQSSHKQSVVNYYQKLLDDKKIYHDQYRGWYCQVEESFISDQEVYDGNVSKCGHQVENVVESNSFLQIEEQRQYVTELIRNSSGKYTKELLAEFLNMKNLCLTRPKSRVQWGIDAPMLNDHIIYVWFDALLGYLQSIPQNQEIKFHHVLGKDILKFHHIHLPLIYKQLGIDYNATYSVHSHWILDGVFPFLKYKKINREKCQRVQIMLFAHRLYFKNTIRVRQGPQNFDISFEQVQIANTYNDYINSFNNSIYRILNKKVTNQSKLTFELDKLTVTQKENLQEFQKQASILRQRLDDNDFFNGYMELRKLFFLLNRFIDHYAPWNIANQIEKNDIIAAIIVQALVITTYLKPFLPEEVDEMNQLIGPSIQQIPQFMSLNINNSDISGLLKRKFK